VKRARQLAALFDAGVRSRVANAVREAEGETGGEIRVVVLAAAGEYAEIAWAGAALGALAGAGLAAFGALAAGVWCVTPTWMALPAASGAALGYLATRLTPALRRWLAGEERLERRVEARARELFLEEQVFATRDRTGILLLVALFERRVAVLGDQGIYSRVPESAWPPITDRVVAGIRAGNPVDALLEAVAACGALLRERGVGRRATDTNELPDLPRVDA
jgi:putative membrane protein